MFQKLLEKKRDDERGFTLIELLVVMVIIGLLAAIAIPLFLGQKGEARESALKNDLRNLATYAETHAVGNNGSYTGFDLAAANTGGYKASNTLTAADTPAAVISAGASAFCLQGTANSQPWSFSSNRPTQLDDVSC